MTIKTEETFSHFK